MKKRAVFLDRDGVLNHERGYLRRPEELELLPGAPEAAAVLSGTGWALVVFTNQSGVGRGYLTESDLDAIHARLRFGIEAAGGRLDGVYSCVHAPDAGCECRKPLPGMLHQAACELDIDLPASFAVGDSARDIAAGHAAGCKTALVLTGHTASYDASKFPDPQPDYVFPALSDFAQWLTDANIN